MLLTTIFITQFVDPSVYGEFRFIFAFVSLMAVVFLLGRDSGIIYYSQHHDINKNILISQESYCGFLVLLLGVVLLYVFQDFVLLNFFSLNIKKEHYQVALIMIPLWGAFNLMISAIKISNMINYSFVLQNLIQRVIRLPFFIIFVLISGNYYSLALSMIISQALLLYIIIKKIQNKFSFEEMKLNVFFLRFKYSLQLGFNTVIVVLLTQIDVLMVGKYTTNENVAVYDICVLLSFVIMLPFVSLVKSSEPLMQAIVKHKEDKIKYLSNLKLSIELSFSILLIYLLASQEILSIFGESYTTGQKTLVTLSLGYMLIVSLGSPIEILNMNGYTRVSTIFLILSLFINIIFNHFFIPIYGTVGASIATVAALLFSKLASLIFIYKKLNFNFLIFYKVYIVFPLFFYMGRLMSFNNSFFQIFYSTFLSICFIVTLISIDSHYRFKVLQFIKKIKHNEN